MKMFDRRPIILFAFWQLVILAFVGRLQLSTAAPKVMDNVLKNRCIDALHVSQPSGCTCKRKAGYSTDMSIFYYGRYCLCNRKPWARNSFTDSEQDEDNSWMELDTISSGSSLQSNNSDSDGGQDTLEAFYMSRNCICTLKGSEPFACNCRYRYGNDDKPTLAPVGNYEAGYQGATVPTWSIALLVLLLGGIIVMSVSGFMLARRKRARNIQLAASSQGPRQFPSARMSSSIAPSQRSSLSRRSSSFRGRPTVNSRASLGPSKTGILSSGKSRAASKTSRLSTSSGNSRSQASGSAPSSAKSGMRSQSGASASRRRPSSLSSSSRRAR